MLAGVCNGLAAYLHIDVTIVRIVFLFLALVTRGGFGLVYLVLAFVIPPADTSEQRAAAHGQPFNARELIDRAKSQYAGFAGGKDWRRRWRREQRAWRQRWRASRWQPQAAWGAAPPAPGDYGTRIVSGAMVPILSVISVLFFWFWAWAVYSLVTTGQVLGQALPGDIPLLGRHSRARLRVPRRRVAAAFRAAPRGVLLAWRPVRRLHPRVGRRALADVRHSRGVDGIPLHPRGAGSHQNAAGCVEEFRLRDDLKVVRLRVIRERSSPTMSLSLSDQQDTHL